LIAWEMDALTRRFTRVSGRVEAVFGYPSESWRSLPGFWVGILHPEDRRRVARAVNQALLDRLPCEIEYRALASDGAVVHVRDQVRVLADREGRPRLIQGRMVVHERPRPEPPEPIRHVRRSRRGRGEYALPVSVYRRTEPMAEREPAPGARPEPQPLTPPAAPPAAGSESRTLAAIGQAVIVSDAEHRVTFWNQAAELLFGWPAVEAIGRLDSELVPARMDSAQNTETIAALVGGRTWTAEVVTRTRAGQAIPVLIAASAISAPDGSPGGFVAIITDLSSVRRAETLRLGEHVMDAVASLGRVAGRELQSLAERIEERARVALERRAAEEMSAELSAIRDAADRAASLALELRAAGRDRDVLVRPADPGELLRQNLPALELLAPLGVRVSTRIEATPRAWLDPVAISQALLNLAADACQAMPDGGRLELRVAPAEIFARRALESGIPPGLFAMLEIRDTRATFEPEDVHRWFDPAAGPAPHALRRAAAHGLIRQCGAHVTVDLTGDGGNGLTVRVYFRTVRSDDIPES
jgi:PAS domain S-box-containing protein